MKFKNILKLLAMLVLLMIPNTAHAKVVKLILLCGKSSTTLVVGLIATGGADQ